MAPASSIRSRPYNSTQSTTHTRRATRAQSVSSIQPLRTIAVAVATTATQYAEARGNRALAAGWTPSAPHVADVADTGGHRDQRTDEHQVIFGGEELQQCQ